MAKISSGSFGIVSLMDLIEDREEVRRINFFGQFKALSWRFQRRPPGHIKELHTNQKHIEPGFAATADRSALPSF